MSEDYPVAKPDSAGKRGEGRTKVRSVAAGSSGRSRNRQVDAKSLDDVLHSVTDFHQTLLLRLEALAHARPSDARMREEVDELIDLITKNAQEVAYARRQLGVKGIEASRPSWNDLK